MNRNLHAFSVVLVFAVLLAPSLRGQDGPVEAVQVDAKGAAEFAEFEAAETKLRDIDKSIREIIEKFRSAEPEEREELRKQFDEKVASVRTQADIVREKGLKAYKAAPGKHEKVEQILLQDTQMRIQFDQYTLAVETITLLLENGCKAKELDSLAGVVSFCLNDFKTAKEYFDEAEKKGTLSGAAIGFQAELPETLKLWETEEKIREKEAKADDLPRVKFSTSKGDIVLELFENEAPQAVGNFVSLVEDGFYDGLVFHRVLSNFMAQGGCPKGTGTGGPGYEIYCECDKDSYRRHFAGSISMAHAGKNTGGSQFFLTFLRTSHLDGKHTVFGRVIDGWEVLGKLQKVDPGRDKPVDKIVKAKVIRKRDHPYAPTKVE